MATPADPTFLAQPNQVADWRLILLYDTAVGSGILGRLPSTPDSIGASLGLDPHGVRVILDALVPWNVVERSTDGGYDMGSAAPDADRSAAMRHHARAVRAWATSLDRRLGGATDDERPGMPAPEVFHDALAATARKSAPALVDACLQRFPGARTVLDLGGLHGEYSLEFTRRGLQATMQDMPGMIEIARSRGRLDAAGVELVSGSFFEAVPDGPFDLAFCTGITHTFDGEHNVTLYRNLRPVVSPAGGIAVTSFFRGRHPLADVFAVQMFVNGSGGDSHSESEYRSWLAQAGFTVDADVVDLADRPQSVLFAT